MGHWVWELTLAPYASTPGKTRTVGCQFVEAVWPPKLLGGGGVGPLHRSCSFGPI